MYSLLTVSISILSNSRHNTAWAGLGWAGYGPFGPFHISGVVSGAALDCTGHGRMGTSISGLQLVIRLKVKAIQIVGNREQRPAAAIIGIIRWKLFSSGVRNGL